jgi:Mg2+/Co2+ transporter CorB
MTQSLDATKTSSFASRLLKKKAGPMGVVIATKALTLVALIASYYIIAFVTAIQIVPLTMGFVKSGTGVTLDMPLELVLSLWIVPALFLVGLVFVLAVVTMRALWRLRARVVTAASQWALGEEPREKTTVVRFGAKTMHRTRNSGATEATEATSPRSKTNTKVA